jgi:phage gp36-like protein
MYCTPDDIIPLTKLAEGEPEEYFQPYIDKAVAFIDSRLSYRYVTPIQAPIPPIIKSICADLAASYILDQHTTERYKEQTYYGDVLYKRAVVELERIIETGELDSVVPLSSGINSSGYRPAIRSTTTGRSEMENILRRGW